jgi:hypothetical protein
LILFVDVIQSWIEKNGKTVLDQRWRTGWEKARVCQMASKVNVWLGNAVNEVNTVIDAIPLITDLGYLDELLRPDSRIFEIWLSVTSKDSDVKVSSKVQDSIEKLASFIKLMRNPYFDSLSVAQDLIIARKATLYYGSYQISWDYFSEAVLVLAPCFDQVKNLFKNSGFKRKFVKPIYYMCVASLTDHC